MPSKEGPLVTAITKAVQRAYPSAWTFKVVGSPTQMSGVPDLLVCIDGHLFGFEVKHQKPGESREHALGRATPIQCRQIERITEAGGTARVILSAGEALDIIDSVIR